MRGDLDQLRILLTVAESGSFTAAAAARNVEVSAISRAIRELEDAIGVALFDRFARGVRLTEAGENYSASARDILDRYDHAAADARRASSGRRAHLDIGFVWSMTSKPMLELLRSFAADLSGATVAVVEAGNDEIIARVRSGRLDIAIAASDPPPLTRIKQIEGLSAMPLWLEQLVDIVPETSILDAANWEDLAGARLLCRTVDDWLRFVRHVERVGGPTLTFEPQAVSQEGVLGLVAAGLGWTIIPASLAHLLPAGVKSVPIVSPGAALQVEALWRADNANPALTRFLGLCRQVYRFSSEGDAPLQMPDPLP